MLALAMAFTAIWGVLQLAVLGCLTRSVRLGVLFLALGNVRAAVITALVIPLSFLFAASAMNRFGISANLLSLGALDFGLIVDGAVVVIENTLRRLGIARERSSRELRPS